MGFLHTFTEGRLVQAPVTSKEDFIRKETLGLIWCRPQSMNVTGAVGLSFRVTEEGSMMRWGLLVSTTAL